MDDGLEDLSGHDGPLDAIALETANCSTELRDAGPVKTLDEAHQLRGGRVPYSYTNYRNARLPRLFGKENRKPPGAGQETDRPLPSILRARNMNIATTILESRTSLLHSRFSIFRR